MLKNKLKNIKIFGINLYKFIIEYTIYLFYCIMGKKNLYLINHWSRPKFKTLCFGIIKNVHSQIFAHELVGVQPLAWPTVNHGLQYATDYVFVTFTVCDSDYRIEKIIGKTPEEYLINLIIAWNKLPKSIGYNINYNGSSSDIEKIISHYQYKLDKLVQCYPDLYYEYFENDYEQTLKQVTEGYLLQYNLPNNKIMPNIIGGKTGYHFLKITVKLVETSQPYAIN